jgi:hypothetical protein
MHPSSEVHVSHWVTHCDAQDVSVERQAWLHSAPPSASAAHGAAQLCSSSAHVPAQLNASIRQAEPQDGPSPDWAASKCGCVAPSLAVALASGAPASVPPTGLDPPSSPATGSKTLKSCRHATLTKASAATTPIAARIRILL